MRNRSRPRLASAAALLLAGAALAAAPSRPATRTPMTASTVHEFRVRTITGEEKSLADYHGRVLLIVNTASRCGFTPQYAALESLYQRYHARGFEVLGFPANDFMHQEPGDNAQIREFCSTKYHVTFPMFEKVSVKGRDIAPLYRYLTKESAKPGAIAWNFTKFLVDGEGRVVGRFGPSTDPLSDGVTHAIEPLLTPDR